MKIKQTKEIPIADYREIQSMLAYCRVRLGFCAGINAVDECIKRMDEANERLKTWGIEY